MDQVLERHSISDAKKNLSGLLADVEETGRPFVILRYGAPVAVVSPYGQEKVKPKLRGALGEYADVRLIGEEKSAWMKAACAK